MRDNVEETLIHVLKKAQESLSNHQKYLKVLQTLYNEVNWRQIVDKHNQTFVYLLLKNTFLDGS